MKKQPKPKSKKEYQLCSSLDDLLKKLKSGIEWLSYIFNIKGYSRTDLKQHLILKVVKDYKGNEDKGTGYWFIRLKWHLLNLAKKESNNPLSNSISLDSVLDGETKK